MWQSHTKPVGQYFSGKSHKTVFRSTLLWIFVFQWKLTVSAICSIQTWQVLVQNISNRWRFVKKHWRDNLLFSAETIGSKVQTSNSAHNNSSHAFNLTTRIQPYRIVTISILNKIEIIDTRESLDIYFCSKVILQFFKLKLLLESYMICVYHLVTYYYI